LESSYQDFQKLIDRKYRAKVYCILFQADILFEAGEEEQACSFAQKARKLATIQDEMEESDKMIKFYCGKSNNR
jgi:hypothetical protein